MENLKLLFELYVRPAGAMSDLMDKGSWFFAAVFVLSVSAVFYFTVDEKLYEAYRIPQFYEFYQPSYDMGDEYSPAAEAEYQKAEAAYKNAFENRKKIPFVGDRFFKFFSFEPTKFIHPILTISIFYVPLLMLLMSFFEKRKSFGAILQSDYGALATCTLMAWASAHLPFTIAGVLLYSQTISPEIYFGMWLASSFIFGIFVVFALRTVCGASFQTGIPAVCIAWLAFTGGMYVFSFISPWLFSPFLLFYGYMYFGGTVSGEVRGVSNNFRQRQNFKRFLHNATVNPKDADAHLQLGLIYLQRNWEVKALEHLNKAVEIDPNEIDANYELGKIARRKGELQKALNHFAVVLGENDKHSLSEIWREIGATYLEAEMLDEAQENLEKFIERRSSDPEGLYYLGKVYKKRGNGEKAKEIFGQVIEAAQSSPDFRRHEIKNWVKLAKKEI